MRPEDTLSPVFRRDVRSLMNAPDLRIDGRTLMDYGADPVDGLIRVGEASPRTSMVEIPGRSGSLDLSLEDDTGRAFEPRRTLEFDAVIVGDGLEAIETKQSLADLNGRIVRVDWEHLPGYWKGRCRVGAYTDTYLVRRFAKSVVTITVDAEPYLYGDSEYFDIGVSGDRFWVHGNRPSPPTITTVPPSGTKRLYLTVNSRQLVYNLTGADGVRKLVADCDEKASTYGDTPVFPSVDSDYPMLVPGYNNASITAGEMRVEYTQRIMI